MRRAFYLYFFVIIASVIYSQNKEIDSLQLCLNNEESDTGKVKILNNLSDKLWRTGNFSASIVKVNTAINMIFALPKKIQNNSNVQGMLAKAYSINGAVNYNQGDYVSALKNHQNSLRIRELIGDKKGIASSNNNIGNVYWYFGNYPEALKFQLYALKIREELGDKQGLASSYNNIGLIYFNLNNFKEARKNFMISLGLKLSKGADGRPISDENGLASVYNNLGLVFYEEKNYKEALENFIASQKLDIETGNRKEEATCFNNIGIVHFKLGNYAEAMKDQMAAIKIQEVSGDKEGMTRSLENIAETYSAQKNFKDALEYCQKALDLASEISALELIKLAHRLFSVIYTDKKDYAPALKHYKQYVALKDSMLNEENTKKTVRLEMNFEFEKKEAAVKLEQEKKEAVAAAENKKQKAIIYSICGILLLVVIFALYAYRSYLQKQKANIEITKQKEIIEAKQLEILDSIRYAKRIQTVLMTSEKYFERNLEKLSKKA